MSAKNMYVMGIITGTHRIEDIGIDCPHNVEVAIPMDLAYQSKDLWRAISQRVIFQLRTRIQTPTEATPVAPPKPVPPPAPVVVADPKLEAENRELKQRLADQEKKIDELRAEQDRKLDAILAAVQRAPQVIHVAAPVATAPGARPATSVASDAVEDVVPMFIPSTIKPDVGEVKIDLADTTSEGSGLTNAQEKLKRLREARKGQ